MGSLTIEYEKDGIKLVVHTRCFGFKPEEAFREIKEWIDAVVG